MRSRVPALLAAAATVILATVTGLVALETWLLATGHQPVTWYTLCAVGAYPLWSYAVVGLISGGIAALGAHFFWSHSSPAPPRPV